MERYPTIQILLNLPQKYIPKAEFVLRTYCSILRLHPQFDYGRRREGVHLYYGSQTGQEYPIKIYFNEETADFLTVWNYILLMKSISIPTVMSISPSYSLSQDLSFLSVLKM